MTIVQCSAKFRPEPELRHGDPQLDAMGIRPVTPLCSARMSSGTLLGATVPAHSLRCGHAEVEYACEPAGFQGSVVLILPDRSLGMIFGPRRFHDSGAPLPITRSTVSPGSGLGGEIGSGPGSGSGPDGSWALLRAGTPRHVRPRTARARPQGSRDGTRGPSWRRRPMNLRSARRRSRSLRPGEPRTLGSSPPGPPA